MTSVRFHLIMSFAYDASEVQQTVLLRELQSSALTLLFPTIVEKNDSALSLTVMRRVLDILDTMAEFPVPGKTLKLCLSHACPQHWRDLVDEDPAVRRAKLRWRHVRWAVRVRPYALHWLEEHVKVQYAPTGVGHKRDRAAFEAFARRVTASSS